MDFVDQAGNNLGNDLLFWELVAVNATNNLEGDPLLVDPVTNRDFHLQAASPAINAGTNAFAPADDFDGVIRPVGATVDIGPYEYGGTPVVVMDDPIVPDDPVTVVNDPTLGDPVDEPVDNTPPAAPMLKLYWTTNGEIQRSDPDGQNIESVVTDMQNHRGIAPDATGDKIYWTVGSESNTPDVTPSLRSAELAGVNANIETLYRGVENPQGIALDVAGNKIYWTDTGTASIQCANLDGTNVQTLVSQGLEAPQDIALDVAGNKMYWTDAGTARIQCANLDGTNVQTLVSTGARSLQGIALDVTDGKIYWIALEATGVNAFGKIQRADLDGSNITDVVNIVQDPDGLALDVVGRKLYWTEWTSFVSTKVITFANSGNINVGNAGVDNTKGPGAIVRSDLNGTNKEDIVQMNERPYDVALGISPTTTVAPGEADKAYPAWDVNTDGQTDITDLVMVATALGTSAPENPRLDVNGDGTVSIQDLILVATHLGETTEAASPTVVAVLERFTPETLQQVLDLLRTQHDGSLAFQRAIATLEHLLATLMPKETALLANYPNPFNPETWMPYQLANPADVVLRIYTVDGSLVRTLSLGHKPVGAYQSRSRAAYWDGRNELGEPVASGVYFYTLTAGDFTATRKMLIRK